MARLAGSPAIAAAFELRPGRYPDETPLGLQETVLARALRAWDLDPRRVDGLLACPAGMAAASARTSSCTTRSSTSSACARGSPRR